MKNENRKVVDSSEGFVMDRYGKAANKNDPALCCPVDLDDTYLDRVPEEIRKRDYGCGDPTEWVNEGETVLDLGAGSGKACYILSQKVGPDGQVIGVDFNDEMLDLARSHTSEFAKTMGYENLSFLKGKIQDLSLDLEKVDRRLEENPIQGTEDLVEFQDWCSRLKLEEPMISDNSVDVIISNCVLNLVRLSDRAQLFLEMKRVLKRRGRVVISDIVCDEEPTEEMKNDPDLWSGCISGAFREDRLLERFQEAGFYGIEILSRGDDPWKVIDGIEFWSMTVRAFKGKEGPCIERNHAVVYRGPWKAVIDDDGHRLERGRRMAVCDKTYNIYTREGSPYRDQVIGVPPHNDIPIEEGSAFDCSRSYRHPVETKGVDYDETINSGSESSCC